MDPIISSSPSLTSSTKSTNTTQPSDPSINFQALLQQAKKNLGSMTGGSGFGFPPIDSEDSGAGSLSSLFGENTSSSSSSSSSDITSVFRLEIQSAMSKMNNGAPSIPSDSEDEHHSTQFSHHIFGFAVHIVGELKTETDQNKKEKLEDKLDSIIAHMFAHALTGKCGGETLDKLTSLMQGLDSNSRPYKLIQANFKAIESYKPGDSTGGDPSSLMVNKSIKKLQDRLAAMFSLDGTEDEAESTEDGTSTETTDTTDQTGSTETSNSVDTTTTNSTSDTSTSSGS